MTWLATCGFMSLVYGRIVQSRVASQVYLLGVNSLGVIQPRITLIDSGFASIAPNNSAIQAFA
jgi:hypothetical protein